jgi:hypothetical protein
VGSDSDFTGLLRESSRATLTLLLVEGLLVSAMACRKTEIPAPKPQVVITTGRQYRDFDPLGQALRTSVRLLMEVSRCDE